MVTKKLESKAYRIEVEKGLKKVHGTYLMRRYERVDTRNPLSLNFECVTDIR